MEAVSYPSALEETELRKRGTPWRYCFVSSSVRRLPGPSLNLDTRLLAPIDAQLTLARDCTRC
jgi:hypothetical protein